MTTSSGLAVTVLGATGYTGSAIVRVAHARGHRVTAISRTTPSDLPDGVEHVAGSALDDDILRRAVESADVVVSALSPRGELSGSLAGVDTKLADFAAAAGVRLGVIGGFGALRPAAGAPRIAEGGDLPPEFAEEAREMVAVLVGLEATPGDWFYVSPSMTYGGPADVTGTWRTGDDIADFDPARAALSAEDFAGAVIAELETPTHHRVVFSVTA